MNTSTQKSPAFSFYVRDALASNRLAMLTGDQFKAFSYLLWNSWLQEPRGTLPNDDAALATMARLRLGEWQFVKEKVLGMFVEGPDGRWHNERLVQVSETQDERSKQNRRNVLRRYSKPKPEGSKDGEVRTYETPTSRKLSVATKGLPTLEDETEAEAEDETEVV